MPSAHPVTTPETRTPALGLGLAVPIFAALYALGFTNLFLRSSLGVMAPALSQEMELSPAMLSVVASAFFFAYALMQLPTGMLLDRLGARVTLAGLLLLTTGGAAVFAAATTPAMLIVGRILMGIGCAGTFTGAFYVLNRWLPPDRVVTQTGALNGFAAFGTFCASAPLAALIALIGWRHSYWMFTLAIATLTIAMALLMRDAPPGAAPSSARSERLVEVLAGVKDAARQPGMWRLMVVGLPISAASTLAGAWGAPFLKDVHGLADIARGNVLLGMALCSMAGHFLYGQLARRLNSIRTVIVGGSIVMTILLAVLALMPGLPLWAAGLLFCGIGLSSAFPTLAHAHARALVPPHLVGRGVAVTNFGIMTAIAFSQLAFGWIVGLGPMIDGVPSPTAYRWAFAMQAGIALAAVLLYAPVQDAKPRG